MLKKFFFKLIKKKFFFLQATDKCSINMTNITCIKVEFLPVTYLDNFPAHTEGLAT